MGMRFLSGGNYNTPSNSGCCGNSYTQQNINIVINQYQPDPFNFKVKREVYKQGYVLVWVNYPDARNFEGNKIILIKGLKTTKHLKSLDPHFLEKGDFEVIARFRPNEFGWKCGLDMISALSVEE